MTDFTDGTGIDLGGRHRDALFLTSKDIILTRNIIIIYYFRTVLAFFFYVGQKLFRNSHMAREQYNNRASRYRIPALVPGSRMATFPTLFFILF